MALVYKIRFKVIDEDGKSTIGTSVGGDDVRELAKIMNKKYRDLRYMELELIDAWDDAIDDFAPGDEGIEIGL